MLALLSLVFAAPAYADPPAGAVADAFANGVAALTAGHDADAEALLKQATAASPKDAEAWWQLGWAQYGQGHFADALASWTKVKELDPSHDELEMRLAGAAYRQKLKDVRVAADVPTKPEGATIRIVAGGDTMMGSDLGHGVSPDDGKVIFAETAPIFRSADVAFLNLEGPLADDLPSTKCKPGSTDCNAFRTPTRYTAALVDAGIDVVSLANNHAMDVGAAGMSSTMAALDAAKIAHAGRYGDVARWTVNGVKIAMVGAHSGSCCVNDNDLDEIRRAVADADQDADVVIFAFHGGAEGPKARHVLGQTEIAWGEPRGDVEAMAHAAVDAGADLVFGTGPHVLRAMEVYRGRLVAYSLGNLCGYKQFGTQGGVGGRSVLLDVTIAANGVAVSGKVHPLALDGDSVPHLDPTGAALADLRELGSADFPGSTVKIGDDGDLEW